jgi:hypothetical protein
MEDGNIWLTVWIFICFLMIPVFAAVILTAPIWISFLAALLFRGGIGVRNEIEKRRNKNDSDEPTSPPEKESNEPTNQPQS